MTVLCRAPCGCEIRCPADHCVQRVVFDVALSLSFCPLHTAAPKLRDACEAALRPLEQAADAEPSSGYYAHAADVVRAAIAAARPPGEFTASSPQWSDWRPPVADMPVVPPLE